MDIPNGRLSVNINSRSWYRYLVPENAGLMSTVPTETLRNGMVVCYSGIRNMFSFFDTHADFYSYLEHIPINERCYFEVVLGECRQKPHFDFDKLPNSLGECKKILSTVIQSVITVMGTLQVNINISKDILVYSSNSDAKKSYHLIVTNYCHVNNEEAKVFALKVSASLPSEYQKHIDMGVYSVKQQFRMLGSQKYQSGRTKVLDTTFIVNSEEYTHIGRDDMLSTYLESFIAYTVGCRDLKVLAREVIKRTYDSQMLSKDEINEAMKLLRTACLPGIPAYKYGGCKGSLIQLKRISKSMCKICNRWHESENSFMVKREGMWHFYCHRNVTLGRDNATSYVLETGELVRPGDPLPVKDVIDEDVELIEYTSSTPTFPSTLLPGAPRLEKCVKLSEVTGDERLLGVPSQKERALIERVPRPEGEERPRPKEVPRPEGKERLPGAPRPKERQTSAKLVMTNDIRTICTNGVTRKAAPSMPTASQSLAVLESICSTSGTEKLQKTINNVIKPIKMRVYDN